MTALWTSTDAATATGGTASGAWQATGISIDSRSVAKGDLFVALSAARDGHDFVADALAKGAAAALVSKIPDGVDPKRLLIVPDVLQGLTDLGLAARARTKAKVVAVTGSVGKTTVKEMLRTALSPQGRTHAAEASFNNHWGVPVTLARMPADTEFAIIEIGMNAPGRNRTAGQTGPAPCGRRHHRRGGPSGGLRRDRRHRPRKGVDLRGPVPPAASHWRTPTSTPPKSSTRRRKRSAPSSPPSAPPTPPISA
jgi:hypothetical protein